MSTIKVTTTPINRKEIAQAFGGNQTVIRQLEAMARDITTNIPGGADDIAAFSEASVALLGRQNSAGLNAEYQVAELQTMLMTMRTLQSDISRLYGLVNEISAIVNATRQRAPSVNYTTIDGAPIGQSVPAAVTGTTVKGIVFQSATSAVASAPSGTAVTVYTFANAAPMCWLVSSSLGFTSNDTTHYDLFAVVLTDGTSARVAFSNAGSNMSVALSGLNLQITQNSGATQPINTVLTRVG